jgi:hypothetical protein
MKKLILSVLAAIAITPMAYALPLTKSGPNAYTGNLINESGLAYSTTVALDLSAYAANKVSVVVVYSSANFTASTFTDGTVSTGNITVVSTTALAGKYLTINRVELVAGTDFAVGYPTTTATNIASAINSHYILSTLMSAQAISTVVYTTSTLVGGNFPLATSDATKVSVSGANMTGGTGAGYSAATDVVRVPSHGFTLGLPILYSGTPVIQGILTGTTYYALPIDSDTIYLATTSALALAGSYINLNAQHANATAATYTLAPLGMEASTAGFYWQESNDNSTYFSVGGSSVTISSNTVNSTVYSRDFSDVNYRYLRAYVVGPTTGGVAIKAVINAKQ